MTILSRSPFCITLLLTLQFHDYVLSLPVLSSPQLVQIAEALADADGALVNGADEFLQILNMCAKTMRALTS